MGQPFRIEPAAPATAYQTYALKRIPGVHTRPARCEEVDCAAYQHGWITRVDISTELGRRQLEYIKKVSGRRWRDVTGLRTPHILELMFEAGQQCFAQHQVSTEREPLYIVRGGDHRGNPTGMQRRHTRAQDWVEDMGEHLDRVREDKQRG